MGEPLLFVEEGFPGPRIPEVVSLSLSSRATTPTHLTTTSLPSSVQASIEDRAWTLLDEIGALPFKGRPLREHFLNGELDLLDVLRFDFYIYFFRDLLRLAALLNHVLPRAAALHARAASPWQRLLLEEAARATSLPLFLHPPSAKARAARLSALLRAKDTIRLNQTAPGLVRGLYAAAHRMEAWRPPPDVPRRGVAGLVYVSNQLDAIVPVLEALPRSDRPYLAIFDDPLRTVQAAAKRLRASHPRLSVVSLNAYAPRSRSAGRQRLAARLAKDRAGLRAALAKAPLAHEAMNLAPAIASIVDSWLFERGRLAEVLDLADTLEAYFAATRPALCLNAVEYTPLGRLWIRLGRRHHVPSLHVPHSLILGQTEHRTIESDAAALQGEASRGYLAKDGTPPEKLHIVGSPKHDALCCRAFRDADIKAALGCSQDKRLVTLATNPVGDDLNDQLLAAAIAACKAHPDVFLAIKLHPLESGALHRQRLDAEGFAQATVVKDFDLYGLLHASSVVVVYYSTVALDAMLLDRPVLTANFSGGEDRYPFAASGAAAGAKSPQEVTAVLGEWLAHPDKDPLQEARRKFVQQYFFKTDGHAAKRTAELIEKLKKA